MLRFWCGCILRLIALGCALACAWSRADEPVLVAVNYDIPADYQAFLNGRHPRDVHFYGGKNSRRDVIDVVLLMQALDLGGFKEAVDIHVEPSYLRILRGIADGQFISSGALMWKVDIDTLKDVYFTSRPVVKEGEFIVGIYAAAKNQKRFSELSPTKLKNLNIVTSSQWRSDVQTLKDLGFKHITYSPNWVNMVRMIEAGRADITLAPFQSTPDKSIMVDDVKLLPITDVTVAISGSRHWPVSRHHPKGSAFYQALERGLEEMEAKGIIEQAYRECGFFNADVANWKLLKRAVDSPQSGSKAPLTNQRWN